MLSEQSRIVAMEDSSLQTFLTTGGDWLWAVAVLVGAGLLGVLVAFVLHRAFRGMTRRAGWTSPLRNALLRHLTGPVRLLVPLLFVYAALPIVEGELPPDAAIVLRGLLRPLFVGALAWLVITLLLAGEEAIAEYYAMDTPDNLKARKVVTQVRILRRIATAVIIVLAIGIVLLQYGPFREVGTGILASAGIVGIVVGIAAQSTLGDLIAGLQIALTQPIRVDDVVIVEGEFGWIEEITLTYVVVRVWDRRRVVLPITHFIENPFENWTRTSTDLIGAVFLYVDYMVPVDALREELQRIVENSEHWDEDVVGLQVTDTSERTVTLRAIASAQDAPTLWNLRCEIREKLVAYVREHYPEALPTLRAHVERPGGGDGPIGAGGA